MSSLRRGPPERFSETISQIASALAMPCLQAWYDPRSSYDVKSSEPQGVAAGARIPSQNPAIGAQFVCRFWAEA